MHDLLLNKTRAVLMAAGISMNLFSSAFCGAPAMMLISVVPVLRFLISGRPVQVIFGATITALHIIFQFCDLSQSQVVESCFTGWIVFGGPTLMMLALVHYWIPVKTGHSKVS